MGSLPAQRIGVFAERARHRAPFPGQVHGVGVYTYSDALFGEQLVARRLAARLGVPSNVTRGMVASARAAARRDAGREERRAPQIAARLAVSARAIARPTYVEWRGGVHAGERAAADLLVHFVGAPPLHVQIKSTDGGAGTLKNLGIESLSGLLGVGDLFEGLSGAARRAVTRHVWRAPFRGSDLATWSQLGEARATVRGKARRELLEVDAKRRYAPYKRLLAHWVARSLAALEDARRRAVVRAFFSLPPGATSGYICVVHDGRAVRLYDLKRLAARVSDAVREVSVAASYNSLSLVDRTGTSVLQLFSSATKGQGYSDPCLRVSLTQYALDRWGLVP